MKKGIFSIMNYYLPLKGISSMHASANVGKDGDTALFFGLSGTGKTTLTADPNRALIGDDMHGWDDDGVFNLEGGCYAKTIKLDPEKEPDIYNAIKRDALLENVVFDEKTGKVDYDDGSKTQNTRVSYPIHHINNIVKPVSKAGAKPATKDIRTLPPGSAYMLQVVSYGQQADAERLKAKLAQEGMRASIQKVSIENKDYFRVRIGPYSDYGTMTSDDYKLSKLGFKAMRLRISRAG